MIDSKYLAKKVIDVIYRCVGGRFESLNSEQEECIFDNFNTHPYTQCPAWGNKLNSVIEEFQKSDLYNQCTAPSLPSEPGGTSIVTGIAFGVVAYCCVRKLQTSKSRGYTEDGHKEPVQSEFNTSKKKSRVYMTLRTRTVIRSI